MPDTSVVIGGEAIPAPSPPVEEKVEPPKEIPATEEQVKELLVSMRQATPTPVKEIRGL